MRRPRPLLGRARAADGGRRLALSGRGRGLRRAASGRWPNGSSGSGSSERPAWRTGHPGPSRRRTSPSPVRVTFIRQLREQHGLPAWAIGRALRMPRSTDGAWLRRLGIEPAAYGPVGAHPALRVAAPGGFVARRHQAAGPVSARRPSHSRQPAPRIAGCRVGRYVHVAVDDHTRLAYVEVLADQRGPTCAAFLERTVTWFGARHITSRRVMSDNGSGYVSRAFRAACAARSHASPSADTALHAADQRESGAPIATRRSSGNGRTCSRMRRPANAGAPCGRGCGITITTGHTRV